MSTNYEPKSLNTDNSNTDTEKEAPTKLASIDAGKSEEEFEKDISALTTRTQTKRRKARVAAIEWQNNQNKEEQEKGEAVEAKPEKKDEKPAEPTTQPPAPVAVEPVVKPVQAPVVVTPEPVVPSVPETPNKVEGEGEKNKGEDEAKEKKETEIEMAEAERAEEIKIGRTLSPTEKHKIRDQVKRDRANRKKANRAQRDEKNKEAKSGKPIVVVPETAICHVHGSAEVLVVSEDLGKNQAFSLNRNLVFAFANLGSIPTSDQRAKVVTLMANLSPHFFNFEVGPPAFCMKTVGTIEKAMIMLRPFLDPKTQSYLLRQPLSYTYHSAYTHWWGWKEDRRQELEGKAWDKFHGIILAHHPEMEGEHTVEEMCEKLSQECVAELRTELLEKPEIKYFRKSEAAKIVRSILDNNKSRYDADRLQEILDGKERAVQDKIEREAALVGEVDNLLGEMGITTAAEKEAAVIDEFGAEMLEWADNLANGRFTTHNDHGLLSSNDLAQMFEDPDTEVQSMSPYSDGEVGSQVTSYVGYDGKNRSLFVTIAVPAMVVERDKDESGNFIPKKNEQGKKIWVKRYIILKAEEAKVVARARENYNIREILKKEPGLSHTAAVVKARAMRDDWAGWKTEGKLKGLLGNMRYYDLSSTIEMLQEKADDVKSAIPKRNTRVGTHDVQQGNANRGEASEAETAAWLNKQSVESISAKPRVKANGK